MKPLNIIIHIKSNMRRSIPTIFTLGLEFGVLIFMIGIGIGQMYSLESNSGGFLYKFATVNVSDNFEKGTIEKIDGVDNVLNAKIENISAMLPIMNCSVPFIKVDVNHMNYIMNKFNANIIEGRLPCKSNEIILTEEALNLLKVKISDNIGTDYNNGLNLKENYQVVGVVRSKYKFYLSALDEDTENKQLFIGIENGKEKEVEKELRKIEDKVESIQAFSDYIEFINMIDNMLKGLGTLAIGIFSVGILISVINLTKTNISAFRGEYSLLRALGYKEKFIRKRVYLQLGIILSLAVIWGGFLGIFINVIFNNLYCIPRGIVYSEFSIYLVIIPVIVGIILFFISSFEINKIIKKMNFVSEIDVLN